MIVPGILETVVSGLFDTNPFELGQGKSFQALENVDAQILRRGYYAAHGSHVVVEGFVVVV
jgi:hypothetical protein